MQRAAIWYVKDTNAANSILQETSLLAWQRRHRMEGYVHLYRFMRLALKWRCYQWLRTYRRRNAIIHNGVSSSLQDHLAVAVHPFHEAEEALQYQQQWQQVNAAINSLPPRLKTIMQFYFLQNQSAAVISRRLHIPANTVREEIKQSIKLLRQSILCGELPAVASTAGNTVQYVGSSVEQQVLALRSQHSFSFHQIALQLNIPQSQVLQHYLNASRSASHNKN